MLIRQGFALPEKMNRQSLGGLAIRMKRAQDLCCTYRLVGGGAWLLGDCLVLEGLTGSSFHQDNPGGEGPMPITVTGEVPGRARVPLGLALEAKSTLPSGLWPLPSCTQG